MWTRIIEKFKWHCKDKMRKTRENTTFNIIGWLNEVLRKWCTFTKNRLCVGILYVSNEIRYIKTCCCYTLSCLLVQHHKAVLASNVIPSRGNKWHFHWPFLFIFHGKRFLKFHETINTVLVFFLHWEMAFVIVARKVRWKIRGTETSVLSYYSETIVQ